MDIVYRQQHRPCSACTDGIDSQSSSRPPQVGTARGALFLGCKLFLVKCDLAVFIKAEPSACQPPRYPRHQVYAPLCVSQCKNRMNYTEIWCLTQRTLRNMFKWSAHITNCHQQCQAFSTFAATRIKSRMHNRETSACSDLELPVEIKGAVRAHHRSLT